MSVSLSDSLLTMLFYFSLICRAVLSRFCAQAILLLSAVRLIQAMCESGMKCGPSETNMVKAATVFRQNVLDYNL